MIQVLVVIVRFIRRYAIIIIWWRRVMIDGRKAGRWLFRCRVTVRLRVIGRPGWWLLSGTGHPRGQNPAVGVVIVIWRLILGRPGLVISGRQSHRMVVVALRIRRGDVGDVRLLGLRYPRRDCSARDLLCAGKRCLDSPERPGENHFVRGRLRGECPDARTGPECRQSAGD